VIGANVEILESVLMAKHKLNHVEMAEHKQEYVLIGIGVHGALAMEEEIVIMGKLRLRLVG